MAVRKTKAKKTSTKVLTKTETKKAASKAKSATSSKKVEAKSIETIDLDRKSLAAHARQAKKELLAFRFNLQAPSLKEYRRKKAEIQKFLSQLN